MDESSPNSPPSSLRSAVILAAGKGLRLGNALPKGLTPLGGRPLLAWIADALAEVGVDTLHLVIGERTDAFEQLATSLQHTMDVRLAVCPDAELGNGRSAAFAETLCADERFFLLMSDHLITAEHLRKVAGHTQAMCALGTSAPAPWIDVPDATKVTLDPAGLIRNIGKELDPFDALDTGVFAMTRAIFPALEEARLAGEYSLTAGNRRLCRDGLLASAPIGDVRWYDIDTPADLKVAEQWVSQARTR